MCGIFGIVCHSSSIAKENILATYLKDMFFLSSNRGMEASGLAIRNENEIKILKRGVPYNILIKSKDYKRYVKDCLDNLNIQKIISLIGHTRLSTNGSGNFDSNNHPIVSNNVIGIHNGIITDCKGPKSLYLKTFISRLFLPRCSTSNFKSLSVKELKVSKQ